MAEYIERDAVLNTIWKTSAEHDVFFPAIMLDAIKSIPAANVRENVAVMNEQPWAEFADRLAQELLQHGATEAVIVTRNIDEDRIATNYYNCNYEKRWILLGHLFTDIILETIETNADMIREMLEQEDEDGGDDT